MRQFAAALIAAALLIARLNDLLQRGFLPGYDALAYLAGAHAVARGASPIGMTERFGSLLSPIYIYPPPLAVFLVPLAALSFPVNLLLWDGLVLGSTILLAVLLARDLGVLRGALAVLLCWPVWESLHLGQVNALVACLVALAMQDRRARGAWLALGALVKLTPGLGLIVLATRGAWRQVMLGAAVGFAVFGATLSIVGVRAWIDGVTFAARMPLDVPWVRSPVGLIELRAGPLVAVALALTIVAVTAWAGRGVDPERALAAAILATLLAARATWPMHMVLALPALAVLWRSRRDVALLVWLCLSIDGVLLVPIGIGIAWMACLWPPLAHMPAQRRAWLTPPSRRPSRRSA